MYNFVSVLFNYFFVDKDKKIWHKTYDIRVIIGNMDILIYTGYMVYSGKCRDNHSNTEYSSNTFLLAVFSEDILRLCNKLSGYIKYRSSINEINNSERTKSHLSYNN